MLRNLYSSTTGRVRTVPLLAAMLAALLTGGCDTAGDQRPSYASQRGPAPPLSLAHHFPPASLAPGDLNPEVLHVIAPAAGRIESASSAISPHTVALRDDKPPSYCRLKDRFDRKETVAYNFDDGRSRLGLKLDADGFSFSDAGNFDINEVKLTYRFRFQPLEHKREKCLYKSSWQGLLPSGYNELYRRESHTVYQELDQELDRIQDRFGGL